MEARASRARKSPLWEAVAWKVDELRKDGRAQSSVDDIEKGCRLYVRGILDWPVASLGRGELADLNTRITKEHGPGVANHAMRPVRAAWNAALRHLDDPPGRNPVSGLKFKRERPRRDPKRGDLIAPEGLAAWRRAVEGMPPVRRDAMLFILLTGLQNADACSVRFDEVNFEAGTIYRPKPKGGEDRAFTVPLAGAALDILRRRREENRVIDRRDVEWAFPSADGTRPLPDLRGELGRGLVTPHALRRTFASAAWAAGVDRLSRKVLMNHTVPTGDIRDRYTRPEDMERLSADVEKTADWLTERMASGPAGAVIPMRARA